MDADEKSPVRCARPVGPMNDRAVSRGETPQEHTQQAPLSTINFYEESGTSCGAFVIPRKREKGIQHMMVAPARKVDTLIEPPQTAL
jgi:hypothetical protein